MRLTNKGIAAVDKIITKIILQRIKASFKRSTEETCLSPVFGNVPTLTKGHLDHSKTL